MISFNEVDVSTKVILMIIILGAWGERCKSDAWHHCFYGKLRSLKKLTLILSSSTRSRNDHFLNSHMYGLENS